MHAVDLIAQAVGASAPLLPCEPVLGICAVTGDETLCLPRKEVLGPSFTNLDGLRAPQSPMIGVNVYTAWFYGYKTDPSKKRLKCPERMSCWICDGKEFRELSRVDIRHLVINGVQSEIWAAYVTTSYKKHGSLWAKVNKGPRGIWRFEGVDADCRNHDAVLEYWDKMNNVLDSGIGRSVIESLNCPPFVIKKTGIKTWMDFDRWARPIYQSGLYQFIAYLLPSKEERKGGVPRDNQYALDF
jgi:hypothetical protein